VSAQKPRPGHPGVVPGEIQQPVTIRLSERLQEIAREIGGGNLTAGIRSALEKQRVDKTLKKSKMRD